MKKITIIFVVFLTTLICVGFYTVYKKNNTHTSLAYSLTYTDATRTTVTLKKKPTRFVCLTAICEDILYELGIKPVAINDSLDTEKEFYGGEGKKIPQIGGSFFQPSLEDIARVKPDLVIGLAGVHDKIRSALTPIAPIYIMDLSTYQDSIKYLLSIGKLTGRTNQAQAAVAAFLHTLESYEKSSPKTITAGLMSGSDVNFSMDTTAALYGGLLSKITAWPWPAPKHLQTGAEQDNTIPYSLEKVLTVNPNVIFIISDGTTHLSTLLSQNPLWHTLKAVQQDHIYEVRPDIWEYGRGTRSLEITMNEAMQKLYPTIVMTSHQ